MDTHIPKRDLMAPDTEPTDEELHLVMREALELAMEMKKLSDDWMKRQLRETVTFVRNAYQARHS